MKKIISVIVSICILIGVIPFYTYSANTTNSVSFEEFSQQFSELNEIYADEPVSNRLIIKSSKSIDKLDSVDLVEGYNDLHIIQFDNSQSAEQALEYYENNKYVEYAEEDMMISASETQTATSITYDNHLSWGSESIGVDDYIDYLGNISELPEIVVGIIDTGIDLDHEFLKNRIIPTGYNVSDSGSLNSEDDDNGHGTHVAGIVVDNTTDNVKIQAYKCLNNSGNGSLSNVCIAINSAIEDNVDVINMSLGAKGISLLLEDTVNNAIEKGITVCVAAGNNGQLAVNYTPANIENCITVGAVNESDQKPLWSNYGNAVDIWAPGSAIYSSYNDGGYKSLNGTSMATPFVTAASALLISNDISLKPNDVKELIKNNSRLLENTFLDFELFSVFIGDLSNYNKERTAQPLFSVEGGVYLEQITLEINCNDKDAEIYYSTNGKRASQDNGVLYTKPIKIDSVTTVSACAYKEGKIRSLQTNVTYNIVTTDPDENFTINSSGMITKYTGNNIYLSIPEQINGITVNGIDNEAFRRNSIKVILLPDTLTYLGTNSFRYCRNLESVYSNNLKTIGNNAFYYCDSLRNIDISNADEIGEYAFYYCEELESVYNNRVTSIKQSTFSSCNKLIYAEFTNTDTIRKSAFDCCLSIESVILPNAENIGENVFNMCEKLTNAHIPKLKTISGINAFRSCYLLKDIYFPLLEGALPNNTFRGSSILNAIFPNLSLIGDSVFEGCRSLKTIYIPLVTSAGNNAFSCDTINIIYAPSLISLHSFSKCNNTKIYLSEKFSGTTISSKFNYDIIAPIGSYAEQWASENGHTFIPSEELRFDSIVGEGFVYSTSDGKTCSMPIDIVEQIWYDYLPINKQPNFMTHGYLIDVVNDNFINGKDLAKIHHTAKYGW